MTYASSFFPQTLPLEEECLPIKILRANLPRVGEADPYPNNLKQSVVNCSCFMCFNKQVLAVTKKRCILNNQTSIIKVGVVLNITNIYRYQRTCE